MLFVTLLLRVNGRASLGGGSFGGVVSSPLSRTGGGPGPWCGGCGGGEFELMTYCIGLEWWFRCYMLHTYALHITIYLFGYIFA